MIRDRCTGAGSDEAARVAHRRLRSAPGRCRILQELRSGAPRGETVSRRPRSHRRRSTWPPRRPSASRVHSSMTLSSFKCRPSPAARTGSERPAPGPRPARPAALCPAVETPPPWRLRASPRTRSPSSRHNRATRLWLTSALRRAASRTAADTRTGAAVGPVPAAGRAEPHRPARVEHPAQRGPRGPQHRKWGGGGVTHHFPDAAPTAVGPVAFLRTCLPDRSTTRAHPIVASNLTSTA